MVLGYCWGCSAPPASWIEDNSEIQGSQPCHLFLHLVTEKEQKHFAHEYSIRKRILTKVCRCVVSSQPRKQTLSVSLPASFLTFRGSDSLAVRHGRTASRSHGSLSALALPRAVTLPGLNSHPSFSHGLFFISLCLPIKKKKNPTQFYCFPFDTRIFLTCVSFSAGQGWREGSIPDNLTREEFSRAFPPQVREPPERCQRCALRDRGMLERQRTTPSVTCRICSAFASTSPPGPGSLGSPGASGS